MVLLYNTSSKQLVRNLNHPSWRNLSYLLLNSNNYQNASDISFSKRLNKRLFHATSSVYQSINDPYKTLGIDKNASSSQIKKAYYKLAKKYHPDINKEPNAEKKFHDLQNAYEILSDDTKRKQYDQFGPAAFNQDGPMGNGQGQGGFNPFYNASSMNGASGNPFGNFGGINFEDLFGAAFNQGNFNTGANGDPFFSQRQNQSIFTGDSVNVRCRISFKDAVFGKSNVNINFKASDPCNVCHGSGLQEGAKRHTCKGCQGTGTKVHIRGGFQMMSTCNECGGEGVVTDPKDNCSNCHGNGVEYHKNKTINVDLPHGLQDGDVIRVPGKGSYPNLAIDLKNNPNVKTFRGDVLINIVVEKDPRFEVRNKYEIWHQMNIPITTAALGGTVNIPTVDGQMIRLKVAPGTQTNDVITIPNMGVPKSNILQTRGPMKVKYKVTMRKPTSKAERCLWEALADITNDESAKRSQDHVNIFNVNETSTKFSEEKGTNKDNTVKSTDTNTKNPDEPSTLSKLESFISNTFKKIKGDNS